MNTSKKTLLKGTSILTISSLITSMSQIILLPLYTRILSPEQYGIVGLITPLITYIPMIFGFNLYIGQSREYVEFRNDKEKLGEYLFTINIFLGIVSLILILLSMSPIGYKLVGILIDYDKVSYYPLIFISIIQGIISIFTIMATMYFQVTQSFKKIAINSLFSFAITNVVSIYLIVKLDFGAKGKVIGGLLGVVFTFVTLFVSYSRNFKIGFELECLKSSLVMGIPMIGTAIMGMIIEYGDRIILGKYASLDIVGIYSLAYTGAILLSVVYNSFINTWKPIFFEFMKEKKNYYKVENTLYKYMGLLIIICLIGQLFAEEGIKIIFSEQYYAAINYVRWLLPAFVMSGVCQYLTNFTQFYRETYYSLTIGIISGILNLVINLLFIPKFGVAAAIISTIFSYIVSASTYSIIIKKKYGHDIKLYKILLLLLICLNPILFYILNQNLTFLIFILKFIYLFIVIIILNKVLFKIDSKEKIVKLINFRKRK